MIAYFDTSAVVPLRVAEAGSARAATLWDGADRAVSTRLVYPEGKICARPRHGVSEG